ncbi:sigma 54-interacting transcriptional regulator [Clostridium sp. D2Q-11]|uniref:Sigma 54-interacting transcriptional regulator n=1 Tax=Anaeromonas frigoriresistens TaxID=2683708 RepID=A0A942UXK0_9FIRM|nr:sigma 54-interacting transcriptional regulator [Anaeromonas frigoriresistens]MBS4537462.1 sigma 54-interacting transcriptional regulator [Anaeromonas frigoriresistens]
MIFNKELTNSITDEANEGLIFIDNKGDIQLYNKRAKEIFGIIYDSGIGHKGGQIKEGDIVIIANNNLGQDDGELTPSDLSYIGINDGEIELGDAIAGIGVYKDDKIKPIYKVLKSYNDHKNLEINTEFLKNKIRITIDFNNKATKIQINGHMYEMEYIKAIGHMVILDRNTQDIKFYQGKGYTIRKESIHDIFLGNKFMEKGKGSKLVEVIGKNIFDIHGYIPEIKEFIKSAEEKDISFTDKFIEINGRPTSCTFIPINKSNKRVGALLKVEDLSEIRRVIKERDDALIKIETMQKKFIGEIDLSKIFPNIIGESSKITNIKRLAYKASKTNSTLLIFGESGTGKSLLAKEIHNVSDRKDNPFIAVNCGGIPESLLESELFGYEKGAFTGAKSEGKKGYFELADKGTIFLDEIGEISPAMQVKLLQVLQNKSFYKVGGAKKIHVDVRIIAATNKNLEKEVLKGNFREDLYYRINVFPIRIPPLRERKEDIYSLVYQLLPKVCYKAGTKIKRLSSEALNKLLTYSWPGNIRELENILERAINLTDGNTIMSRNIHIEFDEKNKDLLNLKEAIIEAEKNHIVKTLRITKGDKKKAMKLLGIKKTSFYDKLKKYGINTP